MFKKSLFVLLVSFLVFSVSACLPVDEEPDVVEEQVAVVVYAKEVSSVDTDARRWPTVDIHMKKSRDPVQMSELLVENVGGVGEYPNSYLMFPDKSKLLINLESKLQVYDFEERSLEDLFIPEKQVMNFLFSDDGDELLIWDQIYASVDDFEYYLHKMDLDTGEVEVLSSGDTDGKYFFLSNWSDEHLVLLYQALGGASAPWSLNLNTGVLGQPDVFEGGAALMNGYSKMGTYLTRVDEFLDDACNDYFGQAPSIYGLFNPVTGERLGSFGVEGRGAHVSVFSPDDMQVLYVTFVPWTEPGEDYSNCAELPEKVYYVSDLPTDEEPEVVEDYVALYNEWYPDETFLEMNFDTSEVVVVLDGEEVFTFNNHERIIDAYYE